MQIERRLPIAPIASALARHAVDEGLAAMPVDAELAGIIRLGASELVTNAVQQAWSEDDDSVTIALMESGGVIRVAVSHRLSAFDVGVTDTTKRPPISGGLGLRLVDEMVDRWGVDEGPPGRVWFEVDSRRRT